MTGVGESKITGEKTGPSDIIMEYLNDKFDGREDSFWQREVGVYHASDLGKCLRQIYYEHELGRRESEGSYPHFHLGNQVEKLVEEALAHHYGRDRVKNSFRIKLEFEDFEVVGQTDPVLLGDNGKVAKLFEVKSTKSLKFREDGPSEHHRMQVHPYMRALGLKTCTLIYVQKNDLAVASHRVPFDRETFEKGRARIERLHEALTCGHPPEPTPFQDWQCRFCGFQEECSSGRP